jgi:hypothetical protein
MSKNVKSEDTFLTVEEAFDYALNHLKGQSKEEDRGKIYVWKQRFKEGNLSHKKVAGILEAAGFHKAVEEKWISLDIKINSPDDENLKSAKNLKSPKKINEAFPK